MLIKTSLKYSLYRSSYLCSISLKTYYWEPCCLVGTSIWVLASQISRGNKSPRKQYHLARTSGLWDNTEHCWDHASFMLAYCHNINDSFGGFSVILSIMRGTDMIIPGTPLFFLYYFPLKSLGAHASQVSCLAMPVVTLDPRSCSNSVLTGSEADRPISVNRL